MHVYYSHDRLSFHSLLYLILYERCYGCWLGFLINFVLEGDEEVVGFLRKSLSNLKSQDLLEKRCMDFAQFVRTRKVDTRLCKFQTWE